MTRIFNCHLLKRWGATPLNLITKAEAVQWRNERVQEARPETVNKELKTLKAALARAVEWELLPASPLETLRGGKERLFLPKRGDRKPDWYTAGQLAALYAASSPRNAALWRLMANTGLRRQEALALRVQDLAEDRITVASTEERPTKGRRTRVIPLNEASQEALATLRAAAPADGHLIRQMSLTSLSRAFRLDAGRAAPPLPGSIHSLRHTFCAHLVMAGVHLRVVQQLAGHASVTTTERYAHLAPDFLANAVTGLAL